MIKAFIENLRLRGSLSHFSIAPLFTILLFFYKQIEIIQIIEILIILLVYSFYLFTVNNHFDRYNDKLNPKKIKSNPVARGDLSVEASFVINLIFFAIMIALTLVWFPNILFLILLQIIIGTFYSYKAKNIPLADILTHGLSSMTFFIIPMFVFNLELNLIIVGSFIVIFGSFIIEIENQIDDYTSDKKAKINTTAIRFGKRTVKNLCYYFALFMIILIYILSIFLGNIIFFIASIWPIYKIYTIRKMN